MAPAAIQRFWKPAAVMLGLMLLLGVHQHQNSIASSTTEAGGASWEDRACSKEEADRYQLGPASRVLVTGGAGFIGSSVMASLAERKLGSAVGLDNFNPYYSPAFKHARAKRLKRDYGLDVVQGDVCNATLLEDLFKANEFTHVVHLAAQAGVRYSLTHPLSYVRNNLECFVTLLEVIRKIPPEKRPSLNYASSSSVYGLNRKIPFSEHDAVTNPANLYGASKFMNEQITKAFNHIYGLKSVGLRFFTVYGPWGRPDMAAFLFTRAIDQGRPLTLYNHGEMRRDFTYIDDIVAGIIGTMQYCSETATVFNLGNNKPVELMHFIEVLEKELGKKAVMKHKVSTAEIKETYADISKAQEQIGYVPHTPIEVGLKNFINWYKNEPRRNTFAGGEFNERRRR